MKSSIIKSLFNKHIRQHLLTDGWYCKDSLIYSEISSGILKGFCFDRSTYNKDLFALYAFVAPLYVPKNYLGLSFSNLLRDPDKCPKWEYDATREEQFGQQLAAAMNQAEKKFLSRVNNASEFYKYYRWNKKHTSRYYEAVAYSAAYLGLRRADRELKNLLALLRKQEDLSVTGMSEIYNNTERLLWSDDRKALFAEWELYTRTALKV